MSVNNIPKLVEYKISKADFNEEGEVYILEILKNNSFIKISDIAKKFIEEVDGEKSYCDIARSLNKKYKANLTEEAVKNIINDKLGKSGLVEGVEYKKDRLLESRLWFHWSLLNADRFERISKKFTFLFNPIVIVIMMLILFLVCIFVLSDVNFVTFMNKKKINYFQSISLFGLFLMILMTSIFHEFGHIVASFRFNAKPRKVGIGLYLLMPVFFVDLSESWMLDRKKRCIIDLGGIYFQLLSIIIFLPMVACENSLFNITNYKIIVYATLTNVLFNLNPTLKMDGYWALSDLTGVVNIHFRTRKRIINVIRKIFRLKVEDDNEYKLTGKAKKIFSVWSMLYIIVTTLFIYIGLTKIMVLIKGNSVKLEFIIIGIVGYILFRILISFLRGKFER